MAELQLANQIDRDRQERERRHEARMAIINDQPVESKRKHFTIRLAFFLSAAVGVVGILCNQPWVAGSFGFVSLAVLVVSMFGGKSEKTEKSGN